MTDLSQLLLKWYSENGRTLPWRVKGGAHPDPYEVLVSEIMLQQTGVQTVIPYFHRFMAAFPTIETLAAASQEQVYLHWQGLGYYSRARSLHHTAKEVTERYGGKIPATQKELLKLKGIGPYTAASILALGFNKPSVVVDGNVIRVICRLYHLESPVHTIQPVIQRYAEELADSDHPADWASAIMDLGATVCIPRNPRCGECPLQAHCQGIKSGDPGRLPVVVKPEKKFKTGRVYLISNDLGELFIQKRPGKGLLSGLYEFPWLEGTGKPFEEAFENTCLTISHTFTHFKLKLEIYQGHINSVPLEGIFVAPDSMENYPFSTLMKRVLNTFNKHANG